MTRFTTIALTGLVLLAATLAAAPGWVGMAATEPPSAVSVLIDEMPMPAVGEVTEESFELS
ncbi:hypothetical protein [Falsiroseomonas oryzae]|uniref:hypothetical protein n=1 Tax=Falsiroseomonas oryzae TaxID=2766473 RepID=UPI0022EB33A8|nr:hypothetical protein [Roseomonas sp. MO-31]